MSGIAGIVHFDGAPVDPMLLDRMTRYMSFRGPDALNTWIAGNVGFGHTLLKTTFESEHERQPFTLDGRTYIVADARVDAQADLIARLDSRGEAAGVRRGVTTDVELILRAYRAWGESCVEHLLGDFSFAIWDADRRRLFAARDHLGVKPFYFAQLGATLIFSNTLDSVRQNPAVSDRLNDLAIADFLLFDMNQEPDTTSFADIQRLPAAHAGVWTSEGLVKRRYWTLPIDEPIYLKRADDYVERFRAKLATTVEDRVRCSALGIFMSGGLDSTMLAASAQRLFRSGPSVSLTAFTTVIDPSVDGTEGSFAAMAAAHLGLKIAYRHITAECVPANWHEGGIHTSEPFSNPLLLSDHLNYFRGISETHRVFLYGEGPDDALTYEWRPHLDYLARSGRFSRMIKDGIALSLHHRRIPLLPTILRQAISPDRSDWSTSFPSWIEEGFSRRLSLRERFETRQQEAGPGDLHPVRPYAHRWLSGHRWATFFEGLDAQALGAPIEIRNPFLDTRMVRFLLSVPAVPWCRDKYLLRRAGRGLLPEPVRTRPKTPLRIDLPWKLAVELGLPSLPISGELAQYVDAERFVSGSVPGLMEFRKDFRVYALCYWLSNRKRNFGARRQIADKQQKEDGVHERIQQRIATARV